VDGVKKIVLTLHSNEKTVAGSIFSPKLDIQLISDMEAK